MSEINVGEGYRKLEPGEKVQKGDELWAGGQWRMAFNHLSGGEQGADCTYRREFPTESFPGLSPEAKDSMAQDQAAMLDLADGIQESAVGDVIYTLDQVKKSQAQPFRMLVIGDTVSQGDEVYHKGKWRPVPPRHYGWVLKGIREPRRRKTAVGHVEDVKAFAGTTAFDLGSVEKSAEVLMSLPAEMRWTNGLEPKDDEFNGPVYNSTMTHVTIPVTHAWHPKTFTPNKYTRWIPTLDGRKVPVDVYCVLSAFPTGSSAVDHAVKKQLAPGARGVKSRVQDLKEARDSLTRAIELEEAVEPTA